VHDVVDEQGRRSQHLARGQAAAGIAADPAGYRGAGPVTVEGCHIEAQLSVVSAQRPAACRCGVKGGEVSVVAVLALACHRVERRLQVIRNAGRVSARAGRAGRQVWRITEIW
jgi:hypothetical protein